MVIHFIHASNHQSSVWCSDRPPCLALFHQKMPNREGFPIHKIMLGSLFSIQISTSVNLHLYIYLSIHRYISVDSLYFSSFIHLSWFIHYNHSTLLVHFISIHEIHLSSSFIYSVLFYLSSLAIIAYQMLVALENFSHGIFENTWAVQSESTIWSRPIQFNKSYPSNVGTSIIPATWEQLTNSNQHQPS